MLGFIDAKILIVAMEGISNILEAGRKNFITETGENLFALQLEMCGGLDRLEELQ